MRSLNLKEIEIKTVNEKWSYYILDDKTILKIKTVLISVFDEGKDPQNNPMFVLQSVNVIGAIPPKELISKDPLDKIEDLEFTQKENPWNEYTLENGSILKIRPTLIQVTRIGTRDIYDIPLYRVQAQPTVKIP